jgi:hypothetical protein
MVLLCWMCVMGGIIDDWMELAFSYVSFPMMLMWWVDACCLGGILLGGITLRY